MSNSIIIYIRSYLKVSLILGILLFIFAQFGTTSQYETNLFLTFITNTTNPENIEYISTNAKLFMFVFILAFLTSTLDTGIGMGYGTIMSPALIFLGFEIKTIVTAILITESFNSIFASLVHHKLKNATITKLSSKDAKVAIILVSFGIIPVILAGIAGVSFNQQIIKTYISLVLIIIGVVLLSGTKFVFSWNKLAFFSILGGFNKGISGGGMGPVYTSGQVVSGISPKHSVACSTFSQLPIDFTGFVTYFILAGGTSVNMVLVLTLFFAGIPGSYLGPHITKTAPKELLRKLIGITIITLGIIIISTTWR